MLSVLSANVYSGFSHVEFLLRNLAAQTCQDFELILMDMLYDENKVQVAELSSQLGLINRIIHTPACEDAHVGHYVHWEMHNNTLLLATNEWVLFHGVKRYLHRQAVQTVLDKTAAGVCTVFVQKPSTEESLSGRQFDDIENQYAMSVKPYKFSYLSQSGLFSIKKDVLINDLNGHSEALVLHHWVDCDLSARAFHLPLNVEMVDSALLRLHRTGTYTTIRHRHAFCDKEVNPNCIAHYFLPYSVKPRIDTPVERFMYAGWEWVRCDVCGMIGVEDENAYVARLQSDKTYIRAPINIAGIGRNLVRLSDDLEGLTLPEKIDIISKSHDNKRYLE